MRNAPPASLRTFLKAYDASIGRLFLATRAAVLDAAPDANELVYDAYNAVTACYTFTSRMKEGFCHVAAYATHVNLGFNYGAELTDPLRLLQGTGRRIRHVRIAKPEDLKQRGLRQLVIAAIAQSRAMATDSPARKPSSKPTSVVRGSYPIKRRPLAREWHEQHRMPRSATLDQRIAWHVEHAKRCGCRPIPDSIVSALEQRRKKRRPAR